MPISQGIQEQQAAYEGRRPWDWYHMRPASTLLIMTGFLDSWQARSRYENSELVQELQHYAPWAFEEGK